MKSPRERERKKGGKKGELWGYFSSSHRGGLVGVRSSSSCLTDGSPVSSRTAPLLSALLSCAAALRLRPQVLRAPPLLPPASSPPPFRRHVKAPLQVQRGNTHTHTHTHSLPTTATTTSGGCQSLQRTAEAGKSEESTDEGAGPSYWPWVGKGGGRRRRRRKKLRGKFHDFFFVFFFFFVMRAHGSLFFPPGEGQSGKSKKREASGLEISGQDDDKSECCVSNQQVETLSGPISTI